MGMDTVPEPRRLRSYLHLDTIVKLHKSWVASLRKSSPSDDVEEPGSKGGSGYWSGGEFHYGEQPNQGAAPRSLGIKRAGPVKVNTPQPKPVTPQAEGVTPQANDPIHQATQRLAQHGIKVTDNMPEEYTPEQRAGAIGHVANAFDLLHKHIPGLIQAHQKQGTEVRFEGPQVNRNPDGTGDEIRGSYEEKSPHPLIKINNGAEQTLWHEATHLIDHVLKGRTGFASQDTNHPLNTLAEHLKQQTAHDQMLQRSPAAMRHLYGTGDASDKEWHDYYTDNREVLARFGNQYMNHLAGKAGMNLSEQSSAKEANEEQWSPEELEHYGKYMTEALGAEDFSKGFRAFLDELSKSRKIKAPGSRGGKGYWTPQGTWVYGEKPTKGSYNHERYEAYATYAQNHHQSGSEPQTFGEWFGENGMHGGKPGRDHFEFSPKHPKVQEVREARRVRKTELDHENRTSHTYYWDGTIHHQSMDRTPRGKGTGKDLVKLAATAAAGAGVLTGAHIGFQVLANKLYEKATQGDTEPKKTRRYKDRESWLSGTADLRKEALDLFLSVPHGAGETTDDEHYRALRRLQALLGDINASAPDGTAPLTMAHIIREAKKHQGRDVNSEMYGKKGTSQAVALKSFSGFYKSQSVHNPGSHGSTHWYVDPQGKIVYGDKPAGQASRVARGTQAAEKPQEPQKSGEGPSVPKGPASPVGNPWVRSMAVDYVKQHGIAQQLPDVPYAPLLPEARRKELADAFEATKHNPSDPAVRRSYIALALEVKAQYEHAVRSGMVFTPWGKDSDPYTTSAEMREDVLKNKRLGFYQGGDMPADHPLAQVDPDHGLTYNDMFRAVHDLFGHAQGGYEFGARGEDNAWREHRRMFSETARPALTNETRGQNHWVNNGPHLRRPDGSIPKKGEEGYIPPGERRFADQKAAVLPSWTEEE